jgi:hypothetical protein
MESAKKLIGIVVAMLVLSATPAYSQTLFNGTCMVTAVATFTPVMNASTSSFSMSMNGTGTCVTDGVPASIVKNVDFAVQAEGTLTCEAILAAGFYQVFFWPQPAPPSSSFDSIVTGNAAALTILMLDSPTFTGVLTLSVDPTSSRFGNLARCASTGTSGVSSLSYLGELTFTDPQA